MTAPASGSPLLSRTVPVIVARPRGVLPAAGFALVIKENTRAVTGNVKLKNFFIAAGPPGKIREDFEVAVSRIKPVSLARDQIINLLCFDSAFCFDRCLAAKINLLFPSYVARAKETLARLNAAIFGHRGDLCQATDRSLRAIFHRKIASLGL